LSLAEGGFLGALIGALLPALLVRFLGIVELVLILIMGICLGAAFGSQVLRKSAWVLSSVIAALIMAYRAFHVGVELTPGDAIMPVWLFLTPVVFAATLLFCLSGGLTVFLISRRQSGHAHEGRAPDDGLEQGRGPVGSRDGNGPSECGCARRIGVRWALPLLILVSVSFGSLGWRISEYRRQQRVIAEFERLGAHLRYADPRRSEWRASAGGAFWGLFQISLANRLSKVPGLSCGKYATDATLVHIEKLTNLKWLELYDTKVTDAGLVHLRGVANLQVLDIRHAEIGDAGLANLQALSTLTRLNLSGTRVTDAGLAHLTGLTNLQSLDLSYTDVTDGAAQALRNKLRETTVFISRPSAWTWESNEDYVPDIGSPGGYVPHTGPPAERRLVRGDWFVSWTDARGVQHNVNCGSGEGGRKSAEERARQVQSELDAGMEVTLGLLLSD
jgi:hypothetical protein